MKSKILAVATMAALVAGCATAPDKIAATTVPVSQYAGESCQQLASEHVRVSTRLEEIVAIQHDTRNADVVGVWMIGLPVGSLTKEGNKAREEEIARLRGERAAIIEAQRAKGCLG